MSLNKVKGAVWDAADNPELAVSNWNAAYGWGDHSLAGYLTSYSETDPVFLSSPAAGILSSDITNWDTAFGWGDHSSVGYLTDAPSDGNQYSRQNGSWAVISVGASALVDLTDVNITTDAGVDGYSVTYDHVSGNFVLTDVSGGGGGLAAVVDDTSPELGGDLAVNGHDIIGSLVSMNFYMDGSVYYTLSPSGGNDFSKTIKITNTQPELIFNDTDAAVDSKNWILRGIDGRLEIENLTDANAASGKRSRFRGNSGDLDYFEFSQDSFTSTWFQIDNDLGKLKIGDINGPVGADVGSVLISTGNSGVASPNTSADDLVIENDGSAGMSVFVPDSGSYQTRLAFGSPNKSVNACGLRYQPDDNLMQLGGINPTGGVLEVALGYNNGQYGLFIDSTGRISTGGLPDALGAEAGSVTISTGNSGVTSPNSTADDLVIESDGTAGISILTTTGSSEQGRIVFGNSTDTISAGMRYFQDDDTLKVGTLVDGNDDAELVLHGGNGADRVYLNNNRMLIDGASLAVNDAATPDENWIINGDFQVWQRGDGPQTTTGYGSADRWRSVFDGDTGSATHETFAVGASDVTGSTKDYYEAVITTGGGASNVSILQQRIEDVTRFDNIVINVSFEAKADAAKDIAVEIEQVFGTGGSASVRVSPQTVSLTTSWARYEVQITMPSISGKTVGADSYGNLNFFLSAGSDYNARTNSLGNQSGTFSITNVRVARGPINGQEFRNRPYYEELRLCQRYYWKGRLPGLGGAYMWSGANQGALVAANLTFPVTMRANPTVAVSGASYDRCTNLDVLANCPDGLVHRVNKDATDSGYRVTNGVYTADAEL